MLIVKRILCPTDLSEPSFQALEMATEIARQFQAELLVMHVVPQVPPMVPGPGYSAFPIEGYQEALVENARTAMASLVKEKIPPDVATQTRVVTGDPAAQIMLVSEDDKVDLVVIATHGLSGWRHLIFGSVTEKVLRLATRPVLVLRQKQEP